MSRRKKKAVEEAPEKEAPKEKEPRSEKKKKEAPAPVVAPAPKEAPPARPAEVRLINTSPAPVYVEDIRLGTGEGVTVPAESVTEETRQDRRIYIRTL